MGTRQTHPAFRFLKNLSLRQAQDNTNSDVAPLRKELLRLIKKFTTTTTATCLVRLSIAYRVDTAIISANYFCTPFLCSFVNGSP